MRPIELILLRRARAPRRVTFGGRQLALLAGGALVCVVAAAAAGYFIARGVAPGVLARKTHALQRQLAGTSALLHKARIQSRASNDAIMARMARLDTHVSRLDAVGAEIASLAHLGKNRFDFKSPPGEGGPMRAGEVPWTRPKLIAATNALSERVWQESRQLSALKAYLSDARLASRIIPHGHPVARGWISSGWGWRPDPFDPRYGKHEFHPGIDFADFAGSPIHAIAAGIVTWAGPRYGYGKLVIVDDGDGYSTYYAHAEKILVTVGEIVKRGEDLALVGSTGRSTGPHLFLEVRYKGQPIDPAKFIATKSGVPPLPGKMRYLLPAGSALSG